MNLYHWPHATCLENYSTGDMIAMAETVEEARKKAKEYAIAYLKLWRPWWFSVGGAVDEFYREDFDSFNKKLDDDLALEPDVSSLQAVFISGSE